MPVAVAVPLTILTAGVAPDSATGSFNIPDNNLGDPPSTVTTTQGANGAASVAGSTVTFRPSASFFQGTDTFDYTITDADQGTPETATGTVTVTIPDALPGLANASITTTQGTPSAARALTITPGNGSLAQHTLIVKTAATNGSCALAGTSVTYTPNAGYTGGDSCVITITDENGAGDSADGTITITVTATSSGGGGSGADLPAGGGAVDPWGLAVLGGAAWLRRRRPLRRNGL